MKYKKVLVTGGSGFIGSHVADELSKKGFQVTIYDVKKSKWILKNQKFIEGSISDKLLLNKLVEKNDYVYHFAGISDLNKAYKNALLTLEHNISSSINLLEICANSNVKRFLFASSIYVYSKFGGFYRCSKQAVENYILEYSNIHNLDYTILRFGSIYGPRSNDSNGIYRILKNALLKNKILYKGSKNSIREYIHVKDVAKASVDILSNEFKNKCVNITGNDKIKISNLLTIISDIMNIKTIKYSRDKYEGHYTNTPYTYLPQRGIMYNKNFYYGIEQGLIELIENLDEELR